MAAQAYQLCAAYPAKELWREDPAKPIPRQLARPVPGELVKLVLGELVNLIQGELVKPVPRGLIKFSLGVS